jgi:hypothetical protein
VNNNDYIGLKNSSNNILRNNIIVASKCFATTLVFSIRELSENISYTVTLYINGIASVFTAIIPNGATSFSVASSNNILLNPLDLLSIHISYSS